MPALDPNFDYVLGTPIESDFEADPSVPPAQLLYVVPEFPTPTDAFIAPVNIPAFDPAVQKPPAKLYVVIAPLPVPDGVDASYFLDDSRGFPTGSDDVTIPDPSQPTSVTIHINPATLYGGQRYQPIYVYAK